jgi:hypothetical protein
MEIQLVCAIFCIMLITAYLIYMTIGVKKWLRKIDDDVSTLYGKHRYLKDEHLNSIITSRSRTSDQNTQFDKLFRWHTELQAQVDDLRIKDGRHVTEVCETLLERSYKHGNQLESRTDSRLKDMVKELTERLEAEREIINILVHMTDVDEFNETARKHNPKYNDRTASLDR